MPSGKLAPNMPIDSGLLLLTMMPLVGGLAVSAYVLLIARDEAISAPLRQRMQLGGVIGLGLSVVLTGFFLHIDPGVPTSDVPTGEAEVPAEVESPVAEPSADAEPDPLTPLDYGRFALMLATVLAAGTVLLAESLSVAVLSGAVSAMSVAGVLLTLSTEPVLLGVMALLVLIGLVAFGLWRRGRSEGQSDSPVREPGLISFVGAGLLLVLLAGINYGLTSEAVRSESELADASSLSVGEAPDRALPTDTPPESKTLPRWFVIPGLIVLAGPLFLMGFSKDKRERVSSLSV